MAVVRRQTSPREKHQAGQQGRVPRRDRQRPVSNLEQRVDAEDMVPAAPANDQERDVDLSSFCSIFSHGES